ncbi:MAG: S1 RNA-binding domain-containing protein [Chloroflexi bacterium]|nr:S1 RNA-binding domain-containing protein [Chloroflexota bacterium]OJV94402.1 MAG: 30S ribosomal protein S1 [Chloroflexi bacterium 54-19]
MNSIEEVVTTPQESEVSTETEQVTVPEITGEALPTVTVELDENGPVSLMEQLLNDPASRPRTFEYGQVLEGTVMFKDREEMLVDIGSKSEGIVPNREFQTLSAAEIEGLHIGDSLLVFVVQSQNQEGYTVLSIDKARLEKVWRNLQVLSDANEIVQGDVVGFNKGGLLVELDGVRGFVPSSQVSGIGNGPDAVKQAELARLVSTKIPLKIIEIDRGRNRLILSERQATQEKRDAQKERLLTELEAGQLRDGVVTTIADFGAFVDIGGLDGLVHLSEMSWSRVSHPSEVVKPGDRIKVYVLNVDENRKKVALSIKRTQAEPWSQIAATYAPGQILQATITQVANFGAFARIADGIEGLIHVSELSEERVQHPSSVVKEGDVVNVRLLSLDPQRRRMGLSIRKAAPDYDGTVEAEAAREQETVGASA